MSNPDVSMKLKSYYTGGKLTISVNSEEISGEYAIDINGVNTLYAKDENGQPYTGFLEAKSCLGETECSPGKSFVWNINGEPIWVQNGVARYDLQKISDHNEGLRHSYFRPIVPGTPKDAKGEKMSTTTQLPWSDVILMRTTQDGTKTGMPQPESSGLKAPTETIIPTPPPKAPDFCFGCFDFDTFCC